MKNVNVTILDASHPYTETLPMYCGWKAIYELLYDYFSRNERVWDIPVIINGTIYEASIDIREDTVFLEKQ